MFVSDTAAAPAAKTERDRLPKTCRRLAIDAPEACQFPSGSHAQTANHCEQPADASDSRGVLNALPIADDVPLIVES
jgi:hypothetical protein